MLSDFRHEKQHMKLPFNLEDAKQLGLVLDRYKDRYFFEVLFGVFLVYILYPFKIYKFNILSEKNIFLLENLYCSHD